MRLSALSAVVLLAGCSFEGTVPGDVVVTCRDSSDCPGDMTCQPLVGRCVDPRSPGLRPPALLGPVVVSPRVARRGVPVRVTFQVNEAQERPPVVRAALADGTLEELPLLDVGLAERTFAAELVAAPRTPEGAVRFTADLLDTDGVEARGLELGGATLDFTAPAIVPGATALTLTPSSTNALSRVEAMNETTLAQLGFAVTEPLRRAPRLVFSDPATEAAFSIRYAAATGTSHSFALTLLTAAVPQGAVALSVNLEDVAGNEADVPLVLNPPGLVLDTQPPALEGWTDGGIRLLRAPTGAAFRLGSPGTQLRGAPGATEPGATLIASQSPTSPELARATASPQGGFELTLPADVPSLTLRALDAAGNQSTPRLVRDVAWFASFSGSVPGAGNPNPHRARLLQLLEPTPEPMGGVEVFGNQGLDSVGGGAVTAVGALNWQRLPFGVPLNASSSISPDTVPFSIVWDPFTAKALAFDSRTSTISVWEWNGAGWSQLAPIDPEGDGNPSGSSAERSLSSAAFDEDQRMTLMVSSVIATGPSPPSSATWAWTGTSWRLLARDQPTACLACQLTWDSRRRRVLLFDPPSGLTAAWNSGTQRWETLQVTSVPALLAARPAMAFERHTGRWLRFGGTPVHGETWAFDGTTWSQVASSGPGPRVAAAMAYDPPRRRVLLHGGQLGDGGLGADLWAWDGQGWEQLADAGVARRNAALVSAPALEQTLLVGGGLPMLFQSDGGLRASSGNSQTYIGRTGAAVTFSSPLETLFIAGGVDDAGVLRREVHVFSAAGLFNVQLMPDARQQGSLIADDGLRRLLHVGGLRSDGGLTADTWASPVASLPLGIPASFIWTTLDAGARGPDGGLEMAPRRDAIGFYEPTAQAPALLGGVEPGRTTNALYVLRSQGWVTGAWTLPAAAEACLLNGSALPVPGLPLVVGLGAATTATSSCSATPSISSSSRLWNVEQGQVSAAATLGASNLVNSQLAWEEELGLPVAFGGRSTSTTTTGTASLRFLDEEQWRTLTVLDPDRDGSPGVRFRHALAYLRSRRALVLLGGETSGRPLTDGWQLRLAGTRPALVVQVSLRGALPTGAIPVRLELRGAAGGDEERDAGVRGVRAWVWHQQRWLEAGVPSGPDGSPHTAGIDLPAPFTLAVTDAQVLSELASEATLTLALVPAAGFERRHPRLTVDHVEVELDYAFPESLP